MGNFRNQQDRSNYRRAFNSRKRRSRSHAFTNPALQTDENERRGWMEQRTSDLAEDKMMGFDELPPGSKPRVGWLVNMVSATVEEPLTRRPVQAVDLFFVSDDPSGDFRTSIIARPYMYLAVLPNLMREAEISLRKSFSDTLAEVSTVSLEDISMPNHLAEDKGRPFLKLEARTTGDLYTIREALRPIIERNTERKQRSAAVHTGKDNGFTSTVDGLDAIEDMREYDVAPVNRLAIDKKINVGYWYRVSPGGAPNAQPDQEDYEANLLFDQLDPTAPEKDPDINEAHSNDLFSAHLTKLPEIVERASPVVLAYDIECTKKPLKFPDAESGDMVMMISWMVDGKGYLGINREVVSKDISNFEYNPHPEYQGSFQVFNEPNERALLERFFGEVRLAAPRVFVTFNGDFFDWPFVEKRAFLLGLDMGKEIAMRGNTDDRLSKETKGRSGIHMDVFHWVNRDSYLPQGSRGLKAVTRALLGFEPEEIPPEEMMAAALERPEEMAKYSVSDAVCTYYLYMKYVHPFIFSLCNIIPLNPDDVLRKGSGTLCEMLLMCQAREKSIVAPNKYNGTAIGKLTEDGHVLESETYIGGHVEAIRTGIYRSDLQVEFDINLDALDDLEKTLDDTLHFAITVEGKTKLEDVTNYEEVKGEILKQIQALREKPRRSEKPLIYHLDVSAMYPNIILTNRLQPHAIVTPAQCAACDFNGMSECQRDMEWTWRGEFFPASRGEAEMIQRRAAQEEREKELRKVREMEAVGNNNNAPGAGDASPFAKKRRPRDRPQTKQGGSSTAGIASFNDVASRQNALFRSRLKEYCRTNYRKTQDTRIVEKTATVCQRENPFYVDTVRAFRDRRYEYKALLKKEKKARAQAKEAGDAEAIKRTGNLVVLYDSLQLAHKCILNSFYGYVMRKGARWYSMEMAGIVTNTGGLIIRRAKEFIEKVGLPLELDTDGIWCVLPVSFPENFSFNTKSGKKCSMSYICSVFNSDVAANFTNHQYQDLVDPHTFEYEQRSECSILFEVDGPYRAMVLPASLEEGKSIKKRYAVFNEDGSLAELKGFEIKRRGELKLIKEFQGEIFDRFLAGSTIVECYQKVGETCNKWLDILVSKGEGMSDAAILELLVEQNNMSKSLDEYIIAKQKSCAITCAGRMQEFLGAAIAKDKGLATMYVIARKPEDDQVTSRAIPVQIFEYPNAAVRRRLLRKWTKNADDGELDLRKLLDWNYYKERLAKAILKIVSIPAALQAVDNPVPRIEYPPWLVKKYRELKDTRKQRKLSSFFTVLPKGERPELKTFKSLRDAPNDTDNMKIEDIEDIPIRSWTAAQIVHRRAEAIITRKKRGDLRAKKRTKATGVHPDHLLLKSNAEDPETREFDARNAMLKLMHEPHPDKRYNYPGWVRYAKRVWRAQRAARVHRYASRRAYFPLPPIENDVVYENDKSTGAPLGGESFVVKFGMQKSKKRRRMNDGSSLDYSPINFVNDLQGAPRGAFFKKTVVPLLGAGVLWQNVAVTPVLDKPGEYNLWVLPVRKEHGRFESGYLHCIPLHVKRVLYYNSRVEAAPDLPGVSCSLVKGLTLPRSRVSDYLFRLELCEERFQKTDKDLTSILTDAGAVDGVFGTQSPLDYEIVVTLGTLCSLRKSVSSRMNSKTLLRNGVCLDDLVPKGSESSPYLQKSFDDDNDPLIHQAFLYGSHALDGSTRAIYALVAPIANLVHVVAVTPGGNFSYNLKRAWKRVLEDRRSNAASVSDVPLTEGTDEARISENAILPAECEFTTSGVRTREEAWRELQNLLLQLRNGSHASFKSQTSGLKTILLAQWPALDTAVASEAMFGSKSTKASLRKNISALEECIPAAKSYPVVKISSNAEDGNYMPLGWEPKAVTVALTRFADASNWLQSQVPVSRFAGIPIGNTSSADIHSQALDVLVGRELMNRDHVLWASKSPRPDLGGQEEDDNNLQNEMPSVPEVVEPGSYRTVCIDTELSNLAVATILSSSNVNQLEGTDLAFDAAANIASNGTNQAIPSSKNGETTKEGKIGGKSVGPLDEMAASAPAFRVLKELVSNWDKLASSSTNPNIASVARGLLDHVHRWTRSESSILYDPALARFLGWLIHKVFRQLVGELKSLGATVVYASLSRIILATPKTHTIDGLRYAGFLETTVKEKPLFRHVHFEPLLGVYSVLLFVDRFNYGVLPAPEEAVILSGEFDGSRSQSKNRTYASRDIPHARMMWDIARYLPIPVAVLWTQVVEEFIRRPMVQRLRAEEKEDADAIGNIDAESGGEKDVCDEAKRDADQRRKKRELRPRGDGFVDEVKLLTKSLTGQLLEKVHEIREKTPTLEFPNVPSALNSLGNQRRNPALEFVRSLCHVLSLDVTSTEEVAGMRRCLLQLLGVREFAKEAQFTDPALPVPLHDVICTYCNAVVDLDIARDSRLWAEQEQEQGASQEKEGEKLLWACEYCGNPYDTRQIELDLTRTAQKFYTSYQVQDLICRRCNMVKRENMTAHCPCSGAPFELSVKKKSLQKHLHALESVARFHRFEFLLETVTWMSSCTSSLSPS